MYLCDVHTHTLISPDSRARLSDMIASAEAAGLQELCVTDHCDLLDFEGKPVTAFDWPAALDQYHQAQAALRSPLDLRLGIELGSAPFSPAAARDILAQPGDELDFVLGSLHNWIGVHGSGDLYFSQFGGDPALCREAVEHCLDKTWSLITQCPDCYDSLAHIVYPLRYMKRDGMDVTLADYEERVRAIFTEIARTDHALEVNVCRGKDLDCWPPLLDWFRQCGGQLVTVGSDAHRPDDMAKGVPQGLDMIRAAGFDHVTTFRRRKPVLHRL